MNFELTVSDDSLLGVIDSAKVVERASARKAADQCENDQQDARGDDDDAHDHYHSEIRCESR